MSHTWSCGPNARGEAGAEESRLTAGDTGSH